MATGHRTLRIAAWHNLPSGGGKRALHAHVHGLLERGHSIEVWRPPTSDESYLPLSGLAPEHVVPLDWSDARRPSLLARAGAEVGLLRAAERHCRQCAAEIDDGGFDIVFANGCRFLRVPPLARFLRTPSAIYLNEPHRTLYEALPRLPWAALPWPSSPLALARDSIRVQGLRILVREEQRNAAAFGAILANSLFSRESLLRAYGLEARVCYLGIDTALFTDQNKQREDTIIGVGAFAPEKNIAAVISALAELPEPPPRLVWVGNVAAPRYFDKLKELAAASGVAYDARVNVSDGELVDLLNRAALMVYAPRLEPFGLAPLEANACGLPVVAVAEGGVRETVIDGVNGLLVAHSADLAAAIARLRADPVLAQRLGRQGRALVCERWSLSSAIDRIEQALLSVASGAGVGS